MTPRLIVLLGILWLVSLLWAYRFGVGNEQNVCEAAKVKPLVQAIEHHDQVAAAGNTIERKTVARVKKTEAIFNGIQQGVFQYAQTHPIASECALDPDGMRLWRAANANTKPDGTGSGHAGMPGAGTAALGQDAGSAGRSRSDGEGIPPMPGTSPGTGELDQENP